MVENSKIQSISNLSHVESSKTVCRQTGISKEDTQPSHEIVPNGKMGTEDDRVNLAIARKEIDRSPSIVNTARSVPFQDTEDLLSIANPTTPPSTPFRRASEIEIFNQEQIRRDINAECSPEQIDSLLARSGITHPEPACPRRPDEIVSSKESDLDSSASEYHQPVLNESIELSDNHEALLPEYAVSSESQSTLDAQHHISNDTQDFKDQASKSSMNRDALQDSDSEESDLDKMQNTKMMVHKTRGRDWTSFATDKSLMSDEQVSSSIVSCSSYPSASPEKVDVAVRNIQAVEMPFANGSPSMKTKCTWADIARKAIPDDVTGKNTTKRIETVAPTNVHSTKKHRSSEKDRSSEVATSTWPVVLDTTPAAIHEWPLKETTTVQSRSNDQLATESWAKHLRQISQTKDAKTAKSPKGVNARGAKRVQIHRREDKAAVAAESWPQLTEQVVNGSAIVIPNFNRLGSWAKPLDLSVSKPSLRTEIDEAATRTITTELEQLQRSTSIATQRPGDNIAVAIPQASTHEVHKKLDKEAPLHDKINAAMQSSEPSRRNSRQTESEVNDCAILDNLAKTAAVREISKEVISNEEACVVNLQNWTGLDLCDTPQAHLFSGEVSSPALTTTNICRSRTEQSLDVPVINEESLDDTMIEGDILGIDSKELCAKSECLSDSVIAMSASTRHCWNTPWRRSLDITPSLPKQKGKHRRRQPDKSEGQKSSKQRLGRDNLSKPPTDIGIAGFTEGSVSQSAIKPGLSVVELLHQLPPEYQSLCPAALLEPRGCIHQGNCKLDFVCAWYAFGKECKWQAMKMPCKYAHVRLEHPATTHCNTTKHDANLEEDGEEAESTVWEKVGHRKGNRRGQSKEQRIWDVIHQLRKAHEHGWAVARSS